MSSLSTRSSELHKSASLAPQGLGCAAKRREQDRSPWACLVLGSEAERLSLLCESARRGGWHPYAASSVGEAMRVIDRWQTQLAVIDLGSLPEPNKQTYRQLGAAYSAQPQQLVIVCEDQAEPAGELWARQIGAWLYLPDVEPGHATDELYEQALIVARKTCPEPQELV